MADAITDVIKSFNYDQSNPNINQELRRRIALSMLQQRKAFPKNAGEGITAIGEALGENRMLNKLGAAEGESEAAMQGARSKMKEPGAAADAGDIVVPAAAVRAAALAQDDEPPAPVTRSGVPPVVSPPVVQSAPSGLLSRADAGGIAGPYANNPAQAASLMNPQPTRIAPPTGGPLPTNRFQPQNQPLVPPPQGQIPASTGGYNVLDQQANALPTETNPDARALAAAALMRQQNGPAVPPSNPTVAGQPASPPLNRNLVLSSDPAAGSLTGNMPANTIALAAPGGADFGIRAAPPPVPTAKMAQVAPGIGVQPGAVSGYVPAKPGTLATPPIQPMEPAEIRARKIILDTPPAHRAAVAEGLAGDIAEAQKIRADKQAKLNKVYEDEMLHRRAIDLKREEMLGNQSTRQLSDQKEVEAIQEARAKNQLRQQFGNLPVEDVIKVLQTSKTAAKAGADALSASSAAMEAFDKGAITGFGANQKLDIAKMFTAMGLVDKGNVIANTETFRSAMQPVVAAIMHQTSGTSQLSEGELAFAKAAAAGNITLDAQSIRRLMTIIDKRSKEVIADHQRLTDTMLEGNQKMQAVYGVQMPKSYVSRDDQALQWAKDNPNDPRAAKILQRQGR